MTAPVAEALSARTLVDDGFFQRLSRRVIKNYGVEPEMAEAITEQMFAYLATCAQKPDGAPMLYMSRTVDVAWHAFIEYTPEYDAFFVRHGWRKVHHSPCDGGPDGTRVYPPATEVLPHTVAAIEAAGFRVVPELWSAEVDCDDTCGDDGKPGNPPDCGHSV